MSIGLLVAILLAIPSSVNADETPTSKEYALSSYAGWEWSVQRSSQSNVRKRCFEKPQICSDSEQYVCRWQTRKDPKKKTGGGFIYVLYWDRECGCFPDHKSTLKFGWFVQPAKELALYCMENAGPAWVPYASTWARSRALNWASWAEKPPTVADVTSWISDYRFKGLRGLRPHTKYFSSTPQSTGQKVSVNE